MARRLVPAVADNIMKGRLCAILSAFVISSYAGIWIVGWALAHPRQAPVGPPPVDLDAHSVEFNTDTGATVKAWWCPSYSQLWYCDPVSAEYEHRILAFLQQALLVN